MWKTEPAWKISKQKRDGQKANNVPGPGTYEKGSELGGPKWVFGKSQREVQAKELFPGPGAYDIKPTIPDVPAYLNATIG